MSSVLPFFGLTFLLAWALWFAAATLAPSASVTPGALALLFLPGTFAPGIVALWLTLRADGRAGVKALLGRLFASNVGVRWYVFALGYMAAVKLAAAVAHKVVTGAWPVFGATPWLLLLAATAFSTLFQAGEEIGWRRYALPRLASHLGLASASVVLGVIWACWHLPLFILPGSDVTGQPFPVYLVSVTALSVAMGWLYGHTGGSLLLVMIMHAAINNTKDIVPSAVPGASDALTLNASAMAWLTAGVLWTCGAYFLARMPGPPATDLCMEQPGHRRTMASATDSRPRIHARGGRCRTRS